MMQENSQQIIEKTNHFGAHNYHPKDVVIESAEARWSGIRRAVSIMICCPPIRR